MIDSLVPGPKDAVYWDAALSGFGLKVTPKGRKVFIVMYRTRNGTARLRKYTIGPYGPTTLASARVAAQKILAARAEGRDPAAERREARCGRCWTASRFGGGGLSHPSFGVKTLKLRNASSNRARNSRRLAREVYSRHQQARRGCTPRCNRRPRVSGNCKPGILNTSIDDELVCRPLDPRQLALPWTTRSGPRTPAGPGCWMIEN